MVKCVSVLALHLPHKPNITCTVKRVLYLLFPANAKPDFGEI